MPPVVVKDCEYATLTVPDVSGQAVVIDGAEGGGALGLLTTIEQTKLDTPLRFEARIVKL